jgi:uncharacterized protein YbjT (DUF2867 family)
MTSPLTVVVHGATGSQGLPVVRALLERGHRVRGLARHAEHLAALAPDAEPVAVDLADPGALADAYAGADAVVAQLPLVFDPERAAAQAQAVGAAVAQAGVARVVLNTGGPNPPEPVGVPYLDARTHLRQALEAGPARTLTLGPAAAYAENLALPGSARRVLEGMLAYPLPEFVPVPWLATADLAAYAADAVRSGEEGSLVLVGPEALTGTSAAAAIGGAVGRELAWATIEPAEYEELLRGAIGPEAAAGIAGFYAAAADAPPPPAPDPASVGAGSTTLAAWAAGQDWEALAAEDRTPVR